MNVEAIQNDRKRGQKTRGTIRPLMSTEEWDEAGKRYGEALVFSLLVCGYLCLYYIDIPGLLLLFIVSLVSATILLKRGFLWASSLASVWQKWIARLMVPLIGLLFAGIVFYPWPINLAFFVSAPALEHLADRVFEEGYLDQPQWAGLFHVAASRIEDENVALLVKTRYGGCLGLVRFAEKRSGEFSPGPITNLNWDHQLSSRWYFQEED